MNKFGGNWTEKKLNAFVKYVKAYLTILKIILGKRFILMALLAQERGSYIKLMKNSFKILLEKIEMSSFCMKVRCHGFLS